MVLSIPTGWVTRHETLIMPVPSKRKSLRQSNDHTAIMKLATGMPTFGLTIA